MKWLGMRKPPPRIRDFATSCAFLFAFAGLKFLEVYDGPQSKSNGRGRPFYIRLPGERRTVNELADD
jgi:hypothetical protein